MNKNFLPKITPGENKYKKYKNPIRTSFISNVNYKNECAKL